MFSIIIKVVKVVVNKRAVLCQIQKVPQTKLVNCTSLYTEKLRLSFDIPSASQGAN